MIKRDEDELDRILKNNPFFDELDDWENDLRLYIGGQKKLEELEFVLRSDKENFDNFQAKIAKRTKNGDTFLHAELIPQPFIGDPRAPIWYLLLNPGYSEVDLYDHLGVCPCCNRKMFVGDAVFENGLLDNGRNRHDTLVKRQTLLIEQLRLNREQPFYLLDDAFNTLSNNAMSDAKTGGFGWWRTVLFGANSEKGFLFPECGIKFDPGSVGHKLFALECCPYHSVNFDKRILWPENKYKEFWISLLEWAVDSGKKFIVRNKSVYEQLKANRLDIGARNSVGFSSGQNVSLSIKNLKGEQNVLDDICQVLRDE